MVSTSKESSALLFTIKTFKNYKLSCTTSNCDPTQSYGSRLKHMNPNYLRISPDKFYLFWPNSLFSEKKYSKIVSIIVQYNNLIPHWNASLPPGVHYFKKLKWQYPRMLPHSFYVINKRLKKIFKYFSMCSIPILNPNYCLSLPPKITVYNK